MFSVQIHNLEIYNVEMFSLEKIVEVSRGETTRVVLSLEDRFLVRKDRHQQTILHQRKVAGLDLKAAIEARNLKIAQVVQTNQVEALVATRGNVATKKNKLNSN